MTIELINKIIELGVPLPVYDYTYGKFTIELLKNIPIGDGVTGITMADMFDTFDEACNALITYYGSKRGVK